MPCGSSTHGRFLESRARYHSPFHQMDAGHRCPPRGDLAVIGFPRPAGHRAGDRGTRGGLAHLRRDPSRHTVFAPDANRSGQRPTSGDRLDVSNGRCLRWLDLPSPELLRGDTHSVRRRAVLQHAVQPGDRPRSTDRKRALDSRSRHRPHPALLREPGLPRGGGLDRYGSGGARPLSAAHLLCHAGRPAAGPRCRYGPALSRFR